MGETLPHGIKPLPKSLLSLTHPRPKDVPLAGGFGCELIHRFHREAVLLLEFIQFRLQVFGVSTLLPNAD
ncbi:MAG: hypothetical protein KDA52_09880 [Planctomycetaceae bacterium]|nr:hypothetical protein [Planctomycetaceae bacterium]